MVKYIIIGAALFAIAYFVLWLTGVTQWGKGGDK